MEGVDAKRTIDKSWRYWESSFSPSHQERWTGVVLHVVERKSLKVRLNYRCVTKAICSAPRDNKPVKNTVIMTKLGKINENRHKKVLIWIRSTVKFVKIYSEPNSKIKIQFLLWDFDMKSLLCGLEGDHKTLGTGFDTFMCQSSQFLHTITAKKGESSHRFSPKKPTILVVRFLQKFIEFFFGKNLTLFHLFTARISLNLIEKPWPYLNLKSQ